MSQAKSDNEEVLDCAEGCSGDHKHRWEIEPHTSTDFDTFVCDSDQQALRQLLETAEMVWDQMDPGEERIIKIRKNAS